LKRQSKPSSRILPSGETGAIVTDISWSDGGWPCAQDHLSVEAGHDRSYHHRLATMKKTRHALTPHRRKATKPPSTRQPSRLTQEQIDERVIAEAEDDSAWEPTVHVSRKPTAVGLPASLAQRAAFLAHLHHETILQTWIERVVRERVELEEGAFTLARREAGGLTKDIAVSTERSTYGCHSGGN
jgi:hypothetical protein